MDLVSENVELTQEYLKSVLYYNPDLGVFTWLKRPRKHFKDLRACNTWNARLVGEVAGSIVGDGYRDISINERPHKAHRLAFLWMTGVIPEQVDHEDHMRANNRWGNLRPADNSINQRNATIRADNASGHTGVSWFKASGKWVSYITYQGRRNHLGYFSNIDDAIFARQLANIAYGFHSNHGK